MTKSGNNIVGDSKLQSVCFNFDCRASICLLFIMDWINVDLNRISSGNNTADFHQPCPMAIVHFGRIPYCAVLHHNLYCQLEIYQIKGINPVFILRTPRRVITLQVFLFGYE